LENEREACLFSGKLACASGGEALIFDPMGSENFFFRKGGASPGTRKEGVDYAKRGGGKGYFSLIDLEKKRGENRVDCSRRCREGEKRRCLVKSTGGGGKGERGGTLYLEWKKSNTLHNLSNKKKRKRSEGEKKKGKKGGEKHLTPFQWFEKQGIQLRAN